jgi:molecular chaperone DnaK (HSP70)
LRGAGRTAANLKSEAWWEVDGVSAARAAEPRVMITFEVDGQGHLSLSAREEDRRLSVRRLESTPSGKTAPSPLAEPDDDEDLEEDAPE